MSKKNGKLPHWDLRTLYQGLDADDFVTDFQKMKKDIKALIAEIRCAGY